ncbi:unnamed protein product [Closterium sp. NIES-54]
MCEGGPLEVLCCPTCMQVKFSRFLFSSSEATSRSPLDEVVMNVVGPLKLGAARAEYFLTIVDVYTRMSLVYVLSKKSDVAETVKTDWLPMVERQQDRLVKAIRSDRGGEFLSKDFSMWLKKNGIRHSITMPYSSTMNGITELVNRAIMETACGLLIEAGLPDYIWPDAVRSACVAKNRAFTDVGSNKWVPYMEWIGRKPNVDMLRVFWCMCMALMPKHLRHNKLGAKTIWAVHLGMAQNSKGWLLWDPFTKKFLHVDLPLELSTGSTITRQSPLVNGGQEARNGEEEWEEVQQTSKRAPTLPSRATSTPRIHVTPKQRHESLHVPAAEEEGRGKRRIQAPNRLTFDALGKPAKSALAGAAMMVGDDEEFAFAFFSPVEMLGEPATLNEALESNEAANPPLTVYVDDILIFSPSSDLVKEVMLKLRDKFKCKARDGVSFYLGLHIEQDVEKRCMRVHQRKYVEALADNFGQIEGHVATPLPSRFKCVKGPEEESVGEEERRRFHSFVGSLMYAAVNTRPDIAFATGQLARVVQCPNEEQIAVGMRVAKYLCQTVTVGLQYSEAAQRRQKCADGVEYGRLFLTPFSDASYASEQEDMTSVGGFICCVGGGPTSSERKKQVDQALSTVESEYMALFRAVQKIVWQRRLLAELGEEQQGPTPLYCDSQGSIALAKNPVLHGLTKHMGVKWHWTRSMVAAGDVELHYMKMTVQFADMMTKRLVE